MRWLLPMVVAMSLLAACGVSGDGSAPPLRSGQSATTTAPADPQASPTGPKPTTPTTARSSDGRSGPVPSTTAKPSSSSGRPSDAADLGNDSGPATPPARADDGSSGPPGSFARTLLRPTPATSIVLERLVQAGAAPSSATVSFASDTMNKVSMKPVATPSARSLAPGAKQWSADDIRALADAEGKTVQGGAQAVVRLLFLRGSFEGDPSVLGVTVRGDVVAIFSDSVDSATTPVVTGDDLEEAVVVHELGHVLGLVDLARNTGRADPDHPGHSKNKRSVMYWAVESSLVSQVLTGPPPKTFDDADLSDLAALRNGA